MTKLPEAPPRKVGDFCSVFDPKYDDWFPCKIVATSSLGSEVKLHWRGFGKPKDFWLARSSDRIADLDESPELAGKRSRDSESEEEATSKRVRQESLPGSSSNPEKPNGDLSAEQFIDVLYDSLRRVTRTNSKRCRDDNSDSENGGVPPKRLMTSHVDQSILSSNSGASLNPNQAAPSSAATDGRISGAVAAPPGSGADAGPPPHQSPSDLPEAGVGPVDPMAPIPNLNPTVKCGLCRLPVDRAGVECHGCKAHFHPDGLCLGVDEDVIRVLRSERSGAISYHCCNCRFSDPAVGGGFPQLTKIVGELVKAVKSRVSDSVSPGATAPREAIITQIREVRERDKRKDSIIFRGFGDLSADVLTSNFEVICDLLRIGHVSLSDIRKIGSSPPLYRARVLDDTKRRELFLRCHELRNSDEFRRVYIHKDLTLQQRRDLIAKRNRSGPRNGPIRRSPRSSPSRNLRRTLAEFIPIQESSRGRGSSNPLGRGASGPRGRGSSGTRGRGSSGTRGRGSTGTRGRGPSGSRGRGSSGTRGRGSSGTRGRGPSGSRGRGSSRGHGNSRGRGSSPDRGLLRGRGVSRGRGPYQASEAFPRLGLGRGAGRGSIDQRPNIEPDNDREFGAPMASSSPPAPVRERRYYGNFQDDILHENDGPSHRGRGYFRRRNSDLN